MWLPIPSKQFNRTFFASGMITLSIKLFNSLLNASFSAFPIKRNPSLFPNQTNPEVGKRYHLQIHDQD